MQEILRAKESVKDYVSHLMHCLWRQEVKLYYINQQRAHSIYPYPVTNSNSHLLIPHPRANKVTRPPKRLSKHDQSITNFIHSFTHQLTHTTISSPRRLPPPTPIPTNSTHHSPANVRKLLVNIAAVSPTLPSTYPPIYSYIYLPTHPSPNRPSQPADASSQRASCRLPFPPGSQTPLPSSSPSHPPPLPHFQNP